MSRDETIRSGVSETTTRGSEREIELFIAGLQAEFAEAREKLAQATAEAAAKQFALRRLEWCFVLPVSGEKVCPACHQWDRHHEDCWLGGKDGALASTPLAEAMLRRLERTEAALESVMNALDISEGLPLGTRWADWRKAKEEA